MVISWIKKIWKQGREKAGNFFNAEVRIWKFNISVKKIAVFAAGALMLTATIIGAMA